VQDNKLSPYKIKDNKNIAADPVVRYMNADALKKAIQKTEADMKKMAETLNFIEAARMRDELVKLNELLKESE